MDTTPDWVTAKNEASDERARIYLSRDLEKANQTIKRLKRKVKDLQIRNKNLLGMIYGKKPKTTRPLEKQKNGWFRNG